VNSKSVTVNARVTIEFDGWKDGQVKIVASWRDWLGGYVYQLEQWFPSKRLCLFWKTRARWEYVGGSTTQDVRLARRWAKHYGVEMPKPLR